MVLSPFLQCQNKRSKNDNKKKPHPIGADAALYTLESILYSLHFTPFTPLPQLLEPLLP